MSASGVIFLLFICCQTTLTALNLSEEGDSKFVKSLNSSHDHNLTNGTSNNGDLDANNFSKGSIHVVSWNYDYVSAPFMFTGFVLIICVLKIAYHHLKTISSNLPESCLLILLGVVIGCMFLLEHAEKALKFLRYDSQCFFLVLLPPIILEAAYSLRDRAFIENIGTILMFAVVGTLLNVFIVGPALYLTYYVGAMEKWLQIGFSDCLIFSSLIAAVDPVAVLAIFQEVGVNKMLYFMVFGESLFNDAVTVVVYNMLISMINIESVGASELLLGLAAFVCVTFGGILIGVVFGLLTCLITKYGGHVRVLEPVVFFALAYLSYLTAEMVHFSGIISIIFCGIIQGYYAMENISSKSYISIAYFSKVASNVMESLIFVILGVMLVNQTDAWEHWSTCFALWSLFYCILSRFIVVFGISYLINTFLNGIRRVDYEEQIIMAFGGLRGAISFSLVFMIDQDLMTSKYTLLTTTYFIIIFTVFLQGTTIKPLVRLMRIKLDVQDSTIFKEINRAMINNLLAGVEEIAGHKGTHYWTSFFKHISQTVVRPAVQKNPKRRSSNLLQIYQEGTIQQQISRSVSQVDVPNMAAMCSQLDMLDETDNSTIVSVKILQAQDDLIKDAVKNKKSTFVSKNKLQFVPSTVGHQVKHRPRALSLDSPKELLLFRDMLQSPVLKSSTFAFDDGIDCAVLCKSDDYCSTGHYRDREEWQDNQPTQKGTSYHAKPKPNRQFQSVSRTNEFGCMNPIKECQEEGEALLVPERRTSNISNFTAC